MIKRACLILLVCVVGCKKTDVDSARVSRSYEKYIVEVGKHTIACEVMVCWRRDTLANQLKNGFMTERMYNQCFLSSQVSARFIQDWYELLESFCVDGQGDIGLILKKGRLATESNRDFIMKVQGYYKVYGPPVRK